MQASQCKTQTLLFRLSILLFSLGPLVSSGQSYSVSQSGIYNIEIDTPTYFFPPGDGNEEIQLPFSFTFFGNTYTSCFVGSDGFISFGVDPGGGCCGQQIPDPNDPNNLIAVAWMNVDFISVHHETFGTEPFRRFVITYDLGNPCDSSYYGQVKLYENTNIIEIHTQQWFGGECQGETVTQGLENEDGTEAIEVPGRNFNDDWSVDVGDEDFVSFTPESYALISYVVSQTGNYLLEMDNPTYLAVNEDDTEEIPIGFPFTFYEHTYEYLNIGSDGYISFGPSSGGGCCGQEIPDIDWPNNLIAVAWTNMDWDSVHYEIFGVAPNRRLVITLDYRNPCTETYYGQVKLFETSNVIEIHTQQWDQDQCGGWSATQGLECGDGTRATLVPNRNFNNTWHVQNGEEDFVSFTPYTNSDIIYIVEQTNDYELESETPYEFYVYDNSLFGINIGFDFSFFGIPYNTCFINQNGFISFGDVWNDGCCEGQLIPNANGPNNLIAPCWMDATTDGCCDMGNAYNTFSLESFGSAPNRRLVITYVVPEQCGQYYHGQVKLFEGSNIIEIHSDHWQQWNVTCSNATQGIENMDGTKAYFAPGRNSNQDWTVMIGDSDVVRFIPALAPPASDAGVTHITNDPFCEGDQMMSLLINNLGLQTIDSVEVHWEWDSILQPIILHSVPLSVGGFDYHIDLGTQNLVFGETYTLKAWTSLPNGTNDGNHLNDTMTATIIVGLNGDYTIGGTNPDYTTFAAAIADLGTVGVCDTVRMNVRPGTYNEQIVIPFIPGAFYSGVIFTAENGDSTSVIVQYEAAIEDSNFVVLFNNSFDVTWEKMTLNALGTNYSTVFELRNFSFKNTIRHCAINGKSTNSTSRDYACILSRSKNPNNTYANNTIKNGSFGFYHDIIPIGIIFVSEQNETGSRGGEGDPEDFTENISIIGNSFLDFGYKGIYTYNTKGLQIHHNYMESAANNVWAMQLNTDIDTLSISNNNVYVPAGQYALHLSNLDAPSGKRSSIYNNMFNVTGSLSAIIGTGIYNCTDLNFYNNTIRINSNSVSSFPFYHSGGTLDSVYNNIFANMGTGPGIYTSSTNLNHYDYNNYYSGGTVLGTVGSSAYNAPDLETWRLFTGFDEHTVAVNPLFSSNTNLHVENSFLNGTGSNILMDSLDIDGQTRNTTYPDIGADEFDPVANDAGIVQLLSPILTCSPEQNIEVVLANLGADTLHSVTIKWTLNGIPQADLLYNQTLLPEGDTAHVILTSHIFSNQADTIKIWTSLPNNNPDLQAINDTLEFRYRLPLSGIFTIGGSNPNFSTFKKAVDDLNKYHTCGPVTFRFRDGTYTEQIIIDSIPTTSAINTITFESESLDSSAVTIQFTPPSHTMPAVILLRGTDYVTFQHLGFKSLPAAYSDVLELRYGTTNINISHCQFDGYQFGSSCIQIKSLGFNESKNNLTIENNHFVNGQYAIYITGGQDLQDIHIEKNTFLNQRFMSIRLNAMHGLYIRNNSFASNSSYIPYRGIDLTTSIGQTEISGNAIYLTTQSEGMFLNAMSYSTNSGVAHVFNNIVKTVGLGNGIRIWNSENVYASYNTCHVAGGGIAFELVGGDSIYVKNNVFVSNTGLTFSSNISAAPHVFSDYNDLYSVSGNLGYWNGVTYPTLGDWQTGTGFDANSMSIDPEFVSASDLHVLADTLDGAGTPIAGIVIDFDGNPRNALTPDIGADEIGANDDDAGIIKILPEMPFARGEQEVKAVIRNYGGNTITSVDIEWNLNNVAQPVFNYTGSLPTLQQDTVVLDTVDFLLSTPYIIKSWTSEPNTHTDFYNSNDTLLTNTRYPAVSDTVTIAGTSPDVPTIDAAISALTLGGLLDSVHFQIRNGTYHYALQLPQTMGMSCNTPIIFESESGNSDDVIWDNQSISASTVHLNGADGITFKNLTIKTVQPNYPAIIFGNGAHCNSFVNCSIDGIATTNASTTMATIYSLGSQNNTNLFRDNTIKNGSYGIYWEGAATTTGTKLENNLFQNAYYSGITLINHIAPVLDQNTISTNTTYSYFYGINLVYCNLNTKVTSNQVLLHGKRGVGILLNSSNGSGSQPGLLANNFVVIGNSTSSYGIQQYYCSWTNIYHNTVRITGGGTSGLAYYRTYATNVELKNNIFDNRAGGVALHFGGNEGPLTSNFNNLFSTGTNLVHYSGTNYANLVAWQSSSFDTNSISNDPFYISETDFHVTSAALNATATPIASVPLDIENEPRDTLTPDIGCDEFALASDDVGILAINFPQEPFPSGTNTVFIKFVNNGQDTLTTMQVDWEVDSIPQPTYLWSGLLPSAGTYDSLDIGEFNFESYRTHTIKVWVSQPNGVQDGLAFNDTTLVEDLYPALSGTYTIGGASPSFDSITTAVRHLNLGGAAGPVTFNIRSGTYLETINIFDFPGSECDNPVTFQSESGDSSSVTITNLGIDDNVITLNGADGVIFKKLTLESVHPIHRNVVDYFNGAHCNQFLNNHISGYESNSTSTVHAVILSTNTLDTANVFKNNRIEHGAFGFYLPGNGQNANTLIEHNVLDRNYYMSIYATSEGGNKIIKNTILGSSFSHAWGIYLEWCGGQNIIESNDIRLSSAQFIIRLEGCPAPSGSRGRIVNNFLSSAGTIATIGLIVNNCQYYDIFHNNINVQSTAGSNALSYDTDLSLHIANNIVSNQGVGNAVYANNQSSFTSDYNNYYATDNFGVWNGAGQTDLVGWQSVSGQDANSLSVNPQYMSASNLHVSNILLNSAGTTLGSVSLDIDGDLRNSPPDVGADEFDPSIANDAGVFMYVGPSVPFAHGTQPITIALKNYGYNTLTAADVRWLVNGIEQPVYHWTGTLGSAQCDTIVVGNYSFAPYADHDFTLWSELPNGVPDSTHVNDTLHINDQYPGLAGTYTVGGVLPNFNLFSQLETALNKGGILSDVNFNIRNGMYSTQFVIHNFPRTNYNHKVTFQSETGDSSLVTIKKDFYQPQNNYTITLSNAHNIEFKNLTLASNQGRILEIANQSSIIDIHHCRFSGVDISYAPGTHQLIYSNTTTEDSITIYNNRFEEGDYGISLSGSGGDLEKKITILDNYFYNAYYRSIQTYYHDGLLIKGNTIYNDQNSHEGMVIVAAANTKEISGNDIRLLLGGNYGLFLQSVSGTLATPALISNNYILIKNWSNGPIGIYHSYGNYNNFYYNTVRLENTHPSSVAFYDYQSPNNIHIRNCVLANYSGGLAIFNAWYTGQNSNTMDYCDLYTTGSFLAQYGYQYANLAALQLATSQNLQSISAEPLFASNDYSIFQAACDGSATNTTGIATDIEGESRHASTPDMGCDEFTLLAHDIGAKLLVSPATYCGLSNSEQVTMRIQNYGASTETGFNVAFSMNGSSWQVENVGDLTVSPGGTLDYTFSTSEDLSQIGIYNFKLYSYLASDLNHGNDSILTIQVEHIPALTQPVSNMIPLNNAIHVEKPVSLSWNPAPNATLYDVYLWVSTSSQPMTPQIPNLTSINTSYPSVEYGETYSWKVVAKNTCGQTQTSTIQEFKIRELPDLSVDSISAPSMAVSQQQIQIEWQVKNTGTGNTQSSLWTDAVYLSLDATLNTSYDTYLGGVQNLTALEPNESYMQTGTFTIPQGFTGNYYVFVYADRYGNLLESNDNNNWARTSGQMEITLVPPPDLVIDEVITPATAFSGTTISVQYTGRNNGTGNIGYGTWKDRIKLSEDGSSSAGGIILATLTIDGPLAPDETYSRMVNVTLPNAIFGEYYMYVETDIQNQVYEHAAENNNSGRSDTMDIILTPPPNLIVTGTSVPDTLHSNAYMNFNYTVENAGGTSPAEQYWYDVMYLSPSPVYNINFLTTILSYAKFSPLNPGANYSPNVLARMPVVNEGEYYIYTYTDRYNFVFEHTFENDNYTRFGPYTVVNPDIEPVLINIPASAQSGDVIPVNWFFVNHGPGNVHDRIFRYKYFISTVDTFAVSSSQEIKVTNTNSLTVLSEDSLFIQTTMVLPLGLNDHYYVYVLVEPHSFMHEQNDAYPNNVNRSSSYMDIDPGPYPDLVTLSMTSPDTTTAGDLINITYNQKNQGGADALTRGVEAVYISFSPVWNIEFAQLLSEANYATRLDEDSSIVVMRSISIPASITSNVYYLYILSDKNNIVFEYGGEDNNVHRSNPMFVKPYPPVDIAVDKIALGLDTIYTGLSYPIDYLIRNLEARPLRQIWKDAIYLSTDSIFNAELDQLVTTYNLNTPLLNQGDTFPVSKLSLIPNGLNGDYYIIVRADIEDVNDDVNLANNLNLLRSIEGQAIKVHIKLSPYPDLVVSAIQAPGTAVAGQLLTIAYTIHNMGNGLASTWQDRIYLSSDPDISNGDLLLYSGRINQPLSSGNSVSDTVYVGLPGYLSGNYFMIVRTDYLNELYEYIGESNNNTATVIQVTAPPPSDLIVDIISLADSLLAGDFTTIKWTTKNHGNFPAQGNVREIIYLSADTLWNVEDQVFGFKQNPVYLPPQATHTDSIIAPVIGVINQNYFALVRTDALNNVNESNETNNITPSIDPAYVDVKTLYFDSLTIDSLHTGVELYYKLIIDPTLEGESILVTIDGDSLNTYNELFISFADAPTRGDFDISNNKPLTGSQKAVIRNAQVGTYYILAYGNTESGSDQEITLFARVMSYEILSVSPNRGSNAGIVTVVIDGSRLDSTYAVRLNALDSTGFVLVADTFIIVSNEKIIARFDLRGVEPRFYNVECQVEPYYIAVLENGFEVFEGTGGDLQVNWFLSPGSSSPRNKPVKIVVEMINNGDADVENKYIRVYNPYGNVIAWTYDDLLSGITYPYIDVPVQLQNGFQGVLPPGNSAMYEVFSWLHPYPFFITDIK